MHVPISRIHLIGYLVEDGRTSSVNAKHTFSRTSIMLRFAFCFRSCMILGRTHPLGTKGGWREGPDPPGLLRRQPHASIRKLESTPTPTGDVENLEASQPSTQKKTQTHAKATTHALTYAQTRINGGNLYGSHLACGGHGAANGVYQVYNEAQRYFRRHRLNNAILEPYLIRVILPGGK